MLEMVRNDECDVAVGSRFLPKGPATTSRRPSACSAPSLLRLLMRLRLGQPISDGTSGMYAVNERALGLLSDPYVCEAPEVEALMRITDAKLRLVEVPGAHAPARARRVVVPAAGARSSWSSEIGLTLFAGELARRRYQRRQQKSGVRRVLPGG